MSSQALAFSLRCIVYKVGRRVTLTVILQGEIVDSIIVQAWKYPHNPSNITSAFSGVCYPCSNGALVKSCQDSTPLLLACGSTIQWRVNPQHYLAHWVPTQLAPKGFFIIFWLDSNRFGYKIQPDSLSAALGTWQLTANGSVEELHLLQKKQGAIFFDLNSSETSVAGVHNIEVKLSPGTGFVCVSGKYRVMAVRSGTQPDNNGAQIQQCR